MIQHYSLPYLTRRYAAPSLLEIRQPAKRAEVKRDKTEIETKKTVPKGRLF